MTRTTPSSTLTAGRAAFDGAPPSAIPYVPTPVAWPPSNRWIEAARWGAVVATCGLLFSPPVANLGMALIVVGLLASGQARERLGYTLRHPILWGAALVLAVLLLGMLWSDAAWALRWDRWLSWRKLLLLPFLLALFDEVAWKRRWAVVFVAFCAFAALVILAGALGWLPGVDFHRAGILLRNHGTQAMGLAVAAILALWLATDRVVAPRARLAALLAAAPILGALLWVTPGRSGHLALVIGVTVLALSFVRRARDLAWLALAVAAVGGMVAASPTVQQRYLQAVDEFRAAAPSPELTSFGIRAVMYENTSQMVAERPWLGAGTGGFAAAYAAHIEGKYSDWRGTPTADPHNQYLYFLAELGVLGLLAFLAFLASAALDRGDGSRARAVAVACLLAWAATSLFSSHFATFAEGHLLALVLGVMLAGSVPAPAQRTAIALGRPA